MTETENRQDTPKIVATIIWEIPNIVLRVGVAYLRLRRDSRRATREFRKGMEAEGLPPALAERLAKSYSSDLSLRSLFRKVGSGATRKAYPKPQENNPAN